MPRFAKTPFRGPYLPQGNTQNNNTYNTYVNASARYQSQVTWGQGKVGDDFVTDVRFSITPNRPGTRARVARLV